MELTRSTSPSGDDGRLRSPSWWTMGTPRPRMRAHTPNFEKKSSYAITIVASSGRGDRVLSAKVDVTVHVIDAEDTVGP